MHTYIVLFLVFSSVYSKVLLTEEQLTDSNAIRDEKNEIKAKIYIDLPTVKPQDIRDSSKNIKDGKDTPNKCDNSNDIDGELSDGCKTKENTVDPAVLLTPYIENSRIEEGRRASAVDPNIFLGVESYSGFFTVNKTYNSNIFFWYFPVQNASVNETPWIIWLQGGPGASSLTGLFDEIGPFRVNQNGILQRNPYSWLKNHSLVFIDNPVGTGFSFTNHVDGLARNMETYAKHLYSTVKQLLEVFPELRSAPLYVAGESYAGKYVPALGVQLHWHKLLGKIDVNLQGFLIGNAYIGPSMIKNVVRPFYYFGLLNLEQLESIDPLVKAFQADIDANRSVAAKRKWTQLITVLLLLSNQKHAYNYLRDEMSVGAFVKFLKSTEIKNAIHVGSIQYDFINVTVNTEMGPDFLSTSKELFEELLESYRVLSYCGQLDQLLPCIFAADNHRAWQWSRRDDFLRSTRRPYMFQNRLAGYLRTGGNLTEVVIRGAGHMVPMDQPSRILNLVTKWIRHLPLVADDDATGAMLQLVAYTNTSIYF